MARRLLCLAILLLATRTARADTDWPVRLNVSFPVGYTWGSERLHGFTWGFRGSANVYPTGRGVGFGGYAEMLIDAETHTLSSFGGSVSYPVHAFAPGADWGVDWRVGAYTGVRYSGEGTDDDARLATGVLTELQLPAYLYEFRVGLRLDLTFHGGVSAASLLLDIDLLGLLGLLGQAGAAK